VLQQMLFFAMGMILFSLSLLNVMQPPRYIFWLLSILTREWGHLFALLSLPLVWFGWREGWQGWATAFLTLGAALLFLLPVLTAVPVARRARAELDRLFGEQGGNPLQWTRLFFGRRLPRRPIETLTYAVHGGQVLQMDLIRPNVRPAPVVVVVHGGSWRSGDRKQLSRLNHHLSALGYLVAAIDYRLVPDARFPAPKEDLLAAIAYIKANALDLGADPTRIVLLGRSAGGQIAIITAYAEPDSSVRGAISLYGPFDLAWGYSLPGWILDSKGILGGYLGGSPEEVPEAYREASPLNCVDGRTPPTLLIQGGADVLVSPLHSARLSERLQAANRPHLFVDVPLATHGSDVSLSGPFGQISTYAIERFLRGVFKN
jgi:acetyl esterase/lipase